ncbi:hypothetical protein SCOCK_10151 [Actinacidiphila cocklensis]|uniref:Uncharacterized protein n=1 Tax=Actinacidiphila cocklensis TaxID=887465 RepID=A0A9W4DIK0_9ACTN|nr:hypothetical protein SCOCK_10151 [Actinacidiphila cocklensis]
MSPAQVVTTSWQESASPVKPVTEAGYDLLEEAAEHGISRHLEAKAALLTGDDPVQTLRDAWDLHVSFGLEHPAYYSLSCRRSASRSATRDAMPSLG